MSDALTGLRNRRYLRAFLDREPAPPNRPEPGERRRPQPAEQLTYIEFDLDHFKQINDRYGHDVGDAVLVEVANRLRRTLRSGDAAMRWGGEEFLIVARGLDAEGAKALAGRILRAIAETPVALPGRDPLYITISLGFTPWPWIVEHGGDRARPHDEHLAIALADAGTYLAKLDGRNRAFGVFPGPEADFHKRLADINLGPGVLRPEDGKGVRLVTWAGPSR